MPKINVYLPDDLAAAVRDARLSVSPICQKALAEAVRLVGEAREAAEALRDPDFGPDRYPQVSARVAGRITGHLRQALRRAADLAGPDDAVATEHLLAGVLDEPNNLGTQVLRSLDVDIPGLRAAAVPGGGPAGPSAPGELLAGLSVPARLAVAGALEAAVDLGHDFLGCEHLVLALVDQPGTAGELLHERGVTADGIRRAIPAALSAAALGFANARQQMAPSITNRLDDLSRRLDEFDDRLRAGGL
jgi:ATP-dependent Clp protease ATP-binding subunit ClpA